MHVEFDEGQGWNVSVVGEVDADNCSELEDSLRSADPRGDEFIVETGRLTFIDSSGISSLLRIKREFEEGGATLKLANPTEPVRRALEITGLLGVFGLDGAS